MISVLVNMLSFFLQNMVYTCISLNMKLTFHWSFLLYKFKLDLFIKRMRFTSIKGSKDKFLKYYHAIHVFMYPFNLFVLINIKTSHTLLTSLQNPRMNSEIFLHLYLLKITITADSYQNRFQ